MKPVLPISVVIADGKRLFRADRLGVLAQRPVDLSERSEFPNAVKPCGLKIIAGSWSQRRSRV